MEPILPKSILWPCTPYSENGAGQLRMDAGVTRSCQDGISPSQGADRNGPTATIQSVARIDHLKVLNGTLFNQKISPQCLKTDNDIEKLAALIKTYFACGGHHIQFNVVDAATLKDAQRDPDAHKSLIVRVAGYSAFFNELTKEVQDEIIQRTEHHWT